MNELPESVRPVLQQLARRIAIGLFLDVWPAWAVGSLIVAGLAGLACRLFFAGAAPYLAWLWLAPLLAAIPALVVLVRRAYRPEDVVAFADSLDGGHGLLLTLLEKDDPDWAESPIVEHASRLALPRLRPWRRLAPLAAAAAFLAAVLWLPQRLPSAGGDILADDIAGELAATLVQLKQQELVTPDEERALEEEIERIRRAAGERVDASSWEAADALRERVVSALADKQDALKWAEESLRRYAAATQGGAAGTSESQAEAAELTEAIGKLAKSGLLAGAPADLQRQLAGGKLPTDPEALRNLVASLSKYLNATGLRFSELAALGKEFGRFDPSEFPLYSQASPDGDGNPGVGGINRGRGDAPLTWGKESQRLDRFKAEPLPPGAARSPDDWAPLIEVPGTPEDSPVLSTAGAARRYAESSGQTAWRRTLAPRHQSAVKKYFAGPARAQK
jgi:hypothetical protein